MLDGINLSPAALPFVSVAICVALASLILARDRREPLHWAFAAALAALAVVELGNGVSLLAGEGEVALRGRRLALAGELLMPCGWLVFSLALVSRSIRDVLAEWRTTLWAVGLLTAVCLAVSWSERVYYLQPQPGAQDAILLGPSGRILACLTMVAQVLILANLEQALRQADEHARWYIKFPAVGLGLLCVYFLYQTSDLLLYSRWHADMAWVSGTVAGAACGLIGYGLLRRPLPHIEVYVSPKVVAGSLTFLIIGGALIGTGIIAGLLRYSGLPAGPMLSVAFLVLAVTALVFVMLSSRVRQMLGRFVERHFFPHKYDYRTRWMEVTHAIGAPGTAEQIAWRTVQLCKSMFGPSTVALWIPAAVEEGVWARAAAYHVVGPSRFKGGESVSEWLRTQQGPVGAGHADVPAALADLCADEGATLLVPLVAGGGAVGYLMLGPPSGSRAFSQQDLDLLRCIAAQVADRLQHVMLADRLMMVREMEAFYEYSTFVLHDLKNFVSALSLVMQNAERHGKDPAFLQAAMRSIGATVGKMTDLMSTVAALSRDPSPKPQPLDLNAVVDDLVKRLEPAAGATLVRDQQAVPSVDADPDQLQQVLLNLILNAQEAAGRDGEIRIRTRTQDGDALVIVEDNGCGMDSATIGGLFRPFRSTKGRGLGIGLYQCRKIIQAHRGAFEVESEPGRGSRFVVRLRGAEQPVRARGGDRGRMRQAG